MVSASFGSRGVGEPPCNNAPAAVALAVNDAIGAVVYALPIAPENLWYWPATFARGGGGLETQRGGPDLRWFSLRKERKAKKKELERIK